MMKKFIAFSMLSVLIYRCSDSPTSTSGKSTNKAATCDSCVFDQYIIPQVSGQQGTTTFNSPVAIEFFNLYNLIWKFDGKGKGSQDSLPEKLKHDNRQMIYQTVDQNGMYTHLMEPILDSLNITKIKGNAGAGRLTFTVDSKPYSIDVSGFKETDGIILFAPGKKPVLWNKKQETSCCNTKDFARSYFK